MSNKITLLNDDLWVIRSERIHQDKQKTTRYYETPSTWNSAAIKATIFTSYEAAEGHMRMMKERDIKDSSWADGSIEEFDIVSLSAEIQHSPNSKLIQIKKK